MRQWWPKSARTAPRLSTPSKPRRKRQKPAPKFTLEEAFDYDPGEYLADLVKGILAVAHLLESVSNSGNDPIDGQVAQGLALALRHYGKDAQAYLKQKAEDLTEGGNG